MTGLAFQLSIFNCRSLSSDGAALITVRLFAGWHIRLQLYGLTCSKNPSLSPLFPPNELITLLPAAGDEAGHYSNPLVINSGLPAPLVLPKILMTARRIAGCCHQEFAAGCTGLHDIVRDFDPDCAMGVDWSARQATLNAIGGLECPYVFLCYRQALLNSLLLFAATCLQSAMVLYLACVKRPYINLISLDSYMDRDEKI